MCTQKSIILKYVVRQVFSNQLKINFVFRKKWFLNPKMFLKYYFIIIKYIFLSFFTWRTKVDKKNHSTFAAPFHLPQRKKYISNTFKCKSSHCRREEHRSTCKECARVCVSHAFQYPRHAHISIIRASSITPDLFLYFLDTSLET